jgi:hypothetical protein
VRRREFIALIGGVVVAWPFAARAQHGGKIPRVGFMGNSTAGLEANLIGAFREGLRETATMRVATSRSCFAGREEDTSGFLPSLPNSSPPTWM